MACWKSNAPTGIRRGPSCSSTTAPGPSTRITTVPTVRQLPHRLAPRRRLRATGRRRPALRALRCQDSEQRDLFMAAADHELTGYRWHPSDPGQHRYLGRQRILFATEIDIHQGPLEARRLGPTAARRDWPWSASQRGPRSKAARPGRLTDEDTGGRTATSGHRRRAEPAVRNRAAEAMDGSDR
jgi:hypothetical protein